MDAREKAIDAFATWADRTFGDNFKIEEPLTYYRMSAAWDASREKFENEPGRLVAERECDGTILPSAHDDKNCSCHGTGTIKRRMTRKEVEDECVLIAAHGFLDDMPWRAEKGERVIVEEK